MPVLALRRARWSSSRLRFLPLLTLVALWLSWGWAAATPFQIEVRMLGRPLTSSQRKTVDEAMTRVSSLITSSFVPVQVDEDARACDRALPAVHVLVRHQIS